MTWVVSWNGSNRIIGRIDYRLLSVDGKISTGATDDLDAGEGNTEVSLDENRNCGIWHGEGAKVKRSRLMNILHYEIPQEYENRNDVLVCHYCTWKFGLLAVLCVVLGIFLGIVMTCGLAGNMKGLEKLLFVMMAIGMGVLFVAAGWMFVMYMKNWTVIFNNDGIWYRSMTGKMFRFSQEEVRGYTITNGPKHYYITLWMNQKRIQVDSASPNYYQAKNLVRQKYRKL